MGNEHEPIDIKGVKFNKGNVCSISFVCTLSLFCFLSFYANMVDDLIFFYFLFPTMANELQLACEVFLVYL